MRSAVIIETGRESGYVALCPALPGLIAQGRTKRAAPKIIKAAIEAHIDSLGKTACPSR